MVSLTLLVQYRTIQEALQAARDSYVPEKVVLPSNIEVVDTTSALYPSFWLKPSE